MVIDPKAKYKLKWNVPLNDVDIVEYGPGVNILTSSYRTTISHSKEGMLTYSVLSIWVRLLDNLT